VCGKTGEAADIVSAHTVRDPISLPIRKDHPAWSDRSYICRSDLAEYRNRYVHELLESEKGELSVLEKEVLESLQNQELISANVEREFEHDWSRGERMADKIASFGGSWPFLILFGLFLAAWITVNSIALFTRPVDPYPFILLNLVLSCLASVQAPVILMSQNRQEVKDRKRAQYDYKVNLKAELEIRQIHEKLDHILNKQWEKLMQIQEIQMELLSENGENNDKSGQASFLSKHESIPEG